MSEYIKHNSKLHERRFPTGSDWIIYCPACDCYHHFAVGQPGYYTSLWIFNGDLDKPSFTPSLRMIGGKGEGCHLTLTDGMVYYHADCPHGFAGMTVPMEEI